jgi:hypothetical protein
MNLIYIGDDYYSRSNTFMSSVYQVQKNGSLTRSDWGFVQVALRKGEEIHIRQANDWEKNWADNLLRRIQEKK